MRYCFMGLKGFPSAMPPSVMCASWKGLHDVRAPARPKWWTTCVYGSRRCSGTGLSSVALSHACADTHIAVHLRPILQHLRGGQHDADITEDENLHPKRLLLKG